MDYAYRLFIHGVAQAAWVRDVSELRRRCTEYDSAARVRVEWCRSGSSTVARFS